MKKHLLSVPTRLAKLRELQTETNDLSDLSEENVQIPPTKSLKLQKLSLSSSTSCEVLWDEFSKRDVRLKTIKKKNGKRCIGDICINSGTQQIMEEDDFLVLFSQLGI
ncbi:Hypothetical_protein [Hexamita inflata]|uniref:Hypothetical_protein n=1 Tax=Hexamita inflata TaxID=28002 RepID=A0ABP1GDE6_9EUKA